MFITSKNFDKSYRNSGLFDVYAESIIKAWIQSNIEILEKAELDSLSYDEELSVKKIRDEMMSLKKVKVVSPNQNPFAKGVQYETFYVRPKVVGEEIIKSFELEKGKAGTIGEIRDWRGGKFQKTAKGWVPVKDNKKSNKSAEKTEDKDQTKSAKNAPHYERVKEHVVDEDTGEVIEVERDVRKYSEKEISSMEKKVASAQKEFDRINKKRNDFKEKRDEAEGELNSFRAEIKEKKRQLKQLQDDQEELIAEAMKQSEAAGEAEANRIGGEMDELEQDIEMMEGEVSSYKADLDSWEEDFDEIDSHKMEVQEKLEGLRSKLNIMKNDMVESPKGKSKTPKSDSDRKAYDGIKQWSGDYTDDQIDSVMEQVRPYYDDRDMRVSMVGVSQDKFNDKVNMKVREMMDSVRDGMLHKDLSMGDAKDILWGLVMHHSTK